MDLSTIGGLGITVVIIVVVLIMDGGSPAELFAHPSAILLTFVGSFVATAITVPLEATLSARRDHESIFWREVFSQIGH